MATQEIEAINSSSCIIEVGHGMTMREEDVPDVGGALIFRMSRSLPDSDRLYSPRFVSIGPLHHGKEELKGIEKSKSEAVRRMQIRIQKNHPQASIQSYVERDLLDKDEGWSSATKYFYVKENRGFTCKHDAVFDVNFQNPMRNGVMNDILLFENQIPLWVLKDILQIQMGSPEAADDKLDELAQLMLKCQIRQIIFMWLITSSVDQCSHVLEIFYQGLIGRNVKGYEYRNANQLPPSRNSMQVYFTKGVDSMQAFCRHAVCKRWSKLSLCSPSSKKNPKNIQQTPSSSHNCMHIFFKNRVDSMKIICERWCKMCLGSLSSNTSLGEAIELEFVKLPSALELTRAGVKIHAVTNTEAPDGSAMEWIRFDEDTSTLYLPEIMVTPQLYSVMSNIIAMEVSTIDRYFPRPITQYILFMDDLIDSEADVSVLSNSVVIKNFFGSNQQVAELINSLSSEITPDAECKIINEARRGLHIYMRKKYKILWSEFVSAYFSKPWLVAGSIAAVLLLWMTIGQVLCLFITCNPKSS